MTINEYLKKTLKWTKLSDGTMWLKTGLESDVRTDTLYQFRPAIFITVLLE